VVAALISDTHLPRGRRVLPPTCVATLRAADLIVHAGDFSELSVLEELRSFGEVRAVCGNVDSAEVRAQLPERLELALGDLRLGLVHDAGPRAGRLARLRRAFPGCAAVVFGHSHIPLHERSEDGAFQIFNPGSPTDRRRQPSHTMGVLRVAEGGASFELLRLG
jgi:putative phosphoesterase